MKAKLLLIICLVVPLSGCKAIFGLAEVAVEAAVRIVCHGIAKIIGSTVEKILNQNFVADELTIAKTTHYNQHTKKTETIIQIHATAPHVVSIKNLSINHGDCHTTSLSDHDHTTLSYAAVENYVISDCSYSMVSEVQLDTDLKHYIQTF